jgi:hypothetical protein
MYIDAAAMHEPPIPYDYHDYNSTPVETLKTNTYNVVPLTSRLKANASQRHTCLTLLVLVTYMHVALYIKVSEFAAKRNTQLQSRRNRRRE